MQVIWDLIDVVFLPPDRIQDLCIIFAIIVVFLVFFNTYIFQAGLVSLLIRKFKTTIIISILYLALSVGLHVWTMVSVLFHICSKGNSLFLSKVHSSALCNISNKRRCRILLHFKSARRGLKICCAGGIWGVQWQTTVLNVWYIRIVSIEIKM